MTDTVRQFLLDYKTEICDAGGIWRLLLLLMTSPWEAEQEAVRVCSRLVYITKVPGQSGLPRKTQSQKAKSKQINWRHG